MVAACSQDFPESNFLEQNETNQKAVVDEDNNQTVIIPLTRPPFLDEIHGGEEP